MPLVIMHNELYNAYWLMKKKLFLRNIDNQSVWQIILFLVFTLIILSKNIYSFVCMIDSTQINLSCMSVIRILSTYTVFALIISIISFIYYRQIVSWIILIVTDCWILANLLYYRSYHDLLSIWSIDSINQLQLYDGIIFPYCRLSDLFLILTTLLWVCITYIPRFRKKIITRNLTIFALTSVVVFFIPWTLMAHRSKNIINPFNPYYHDVSMGRVWYAQTFSVTAHGFNELFSLPKRWGDITDESVTVDLQDRLGVHTSVKSDCDVVIVLFESLESWVVDTTIYGNEITENINLLIREPNTLFVKNVFPQVKMGRSADAQLITFTGLLPVTQGITCMRYMNNTYPSLAEASSACFRKIYVPTSPSAWNQDAMTYAFGFKELYAEEVSDRVICNKLLDDVKAQDSSFFVMMTTMASHVPFEMYSDSSDIAMPMDYQYAKYLKSVNYTDACLKPLIDYCLKEKERPILLVITGDHTTLDTPMSNSVPFIMYCSEGVDISDGNMKETLQMDIYPTILNAMGSGEYYWKGLGRNCLDSSAVRVNNAEELSNQLIKSNFFI